MPLSGKPSGLQSAGERLEKIFRSLADGLVVIDGEERVLLLNPAAERLLDLQQKPLFGATLAEIVRDRRLLRRFRTAVRATRPDRQFEYQVGTERPRVVAVEVTSVEEEGEMAGIAFLLRDVTNERELDRLKSEFVSTAAHELRTPLTAILGFSELLLLRDDFSPEQKHDFLGFIHQKAESLAAIISDLLDLSRIEAGRGLDLHRERCDLNFLIRETVQLYGPSDERHGLALTLPEEPVELPVDRGKIVQVLENLLSNAIKYSPRGGLVEVTAALVAGAYQVSVRDQGIGMTREEAARAFEKFYRADSSNAAAAGTGLGLSIARYIVEAHGGHIWLESRKGQGTVASFSLPLPLPEAAGDEHETGEAEWVRLVPSPSRLTGEPPFVPRDAAAHPGP